MALREYLVSYGVQVDEAAVERLFSVLDEDRVLAGEAAAAFAALDTAAKELFSVLAEDGALAGEAASAFTALNTAAENMHSVLAENSTLAGGLTAAFTGLNAAVKTFAESAASLNTADGLRKNGILTESELKKLTPVLKLKADTTDFLKNAEEALNQARSMAAGMMLTIPVKLMPDMSAFDGLGGSGGSGGNGGSAPKGGGSQDSLHITVESVGAGADGLSQTLADVLERRLGGGGYA
ncbi:MAG: hypothetical protein Q4G19_02750 [Clostridia bacterium]|nr:hypothetical protein [Clostridia bacterium]